MKLWNVSGKHVAWVSSAIWGRTYGCHDIHGRYLAGVYRTSYTHPMALTLDGVTPGGGGGGGGGG